METKSNQLTESQFSDAQDKVDALGRAARKGTQEQKDRFALIDAEWETAIALYDYTSDQRRTRLAAIAAVATKHNLTGGPLHS